MVKNAKERLQMFMNDKHHHLLKLMKTIIKEPFFIKNNAYINLEIRDRIRL